MAFHKSDLVRNDRLQDEDRNFHLQLVPQDEGRNCRLVLIRGVEEEEAGLPVSMWAWQLAHAKFYGLTLTSGGRCIAEVAPATSSYNSPSSSTLESTKIINQQK